MGNAPGLGIGTYQNTEPAVCAASVETALNLGYRHVDTAAMYGNEEDVGAGLSAARVDREDVFVATKVHSRDLAYDDVIESAHASRDRLGVDEIDLLYVHWPIRAYEPAETLAAFDALREAGVIRHVGLSNFTPELLEEALAHLDAPLYAHQVECHPLLPQRTLRRYAHEYDHHVIAYSPLAKGAVAEVPELREIGAERGASPAQVALAWLLADGNVWPIPKSSSEAHIRENLEARELSLSSAETERIDAIERRERQVDFEAAPWNG